MLRLCVYVLTCVATLECLAQDAAPPPRPDAIQQRLTSLKKDFVFACKMADDDVLHAIEEEFQAATSDGDLDRAKALRSAKEAFEKQNILPTDSSLSLVRREYDRQFQDARKACLDGFEEVVAEFTRNRDLSRAEDVRAEKQRWLDRITKRKTPRTRYVHPIPKDAIQWHMTGHYYKVLDTGKTPHGIAFPIAKAQCEKLGGYLACGETQKEMEYLRSLAKAGWVGAYKDSEGKWRWITGVRVDKPPRADGAKFDYAVTDPDGPGLLARPENGERVVRTWSYICEWDD